MAFPQSLAPKLPYDIVISIIEDLLAESRDSSECIDVLQTFSLVSQSYVAFCQKRLFRRFNMGRTDTKKCFSIIQRSPHLIPYVEEVWMYVGEARGLVNVTVVEMELLRVLTSLCHLSVVGRYGPWGNLSLSVRRTIVSLLLPRRVTSFAIAGVKALPDGLLTTWRHLNSLSVRNTNPDPNPHRYSDSELDSDDEIRPTQFGDPSSYFAPRATREGSVRLETLSLFHSDKILLSLLLDADKLNKNEVLFAPPPNGSPDPNRAHGLAIAQTYGLFQAKHNLFYFDFGLLREFTIDIVKTNLLPAFSVIHHARNTLETLDIRQRYCYHVQDPFGFNSSLLTGSAKPLPDEVSLESLVHLQHLSITILILEEYIPLHLNALSPWCALLRRTPSCIRTLAITLDAFFIKSVRRLLPWFPDLDFNDNAANTPLSALDEIISNADAFPCLEYVKLRVRLPDNDSVGANSDAGMTEDVVEEDDFLIFQTWLDKPRIPDADEDDTEGRTPSPAAASTASDVIMDDAPAMLDARGADATPDPSEESQESEEGDEDKESVEGQEDGDGEEVEEVEESEEGEESESDISIPSGDTDPDEVLSGASSKAYPLPCERVASSILQMMHLTAKRFGEGDAFVVSLEFQFHPAGARDWGFGKRRVGRMDESIAYYD